MIDLKNKKTCNEEVRGHDGEIFKLEQMQDTYSG